MRISDLSPQVRAKIRAMRWDRIIEKHEGPEDWDSVFRYAEPEFLTIQGRNVLLPLGNEHHPNITVLRCIVSDDGRSLTVFLKDTTFVSDPECEFLQAGFVAICDRLENEDFFVTILYHE